MTDSALFAGTVTHHRLRPRAHRLRYRIVSVVLDLDELPALSRQLRLFSHNRFNLFSFHDEDHGAGQPGPLREWVDTQLSRAGISIEGGPIRLWCMPRILGHAFNPLSVFFCHRRDGTLAALLYEVNNTFGERHAYLIPVREQAATIRQECAKQFYVSPFMAMDMTYRFRVRPPDQRLVVDVEGLDAAGPLIATRFAGERQALRDRTLLGAFRRAPLLGLKVLGGIHWEALKLWRKGLRPHRRPAPPPRPVTIVPWDSA